MTSKIYKIGIELEGKWNRTIEPEIYEDGSVEFEDYSDECNCECYCSDMESGQNCSVCMDGCQGDCDRQTGIGEISSSPMKLKKCLEWIDNNYPDETNNTCGLHIHMSFIDRLSYMKLMSKSFELYFLKRMETWGNKNQVKGEFWRRLKGENTFCKKEFKPDEQTKARGKNGNRYTQLNYCYQLFNTIECRLLPCFRDKWLALSAVKEYYDIVNKYLIRQPKEKEYEFNLEVDESELNELMNGDLSICV